MSSETFCRNTLSQVGRSLRLSVKERRKKVAQKRILVTNILRHARKLGNSGERASGKKTDNRIHGRQSSMSSFRKARMTSFIEISPFQSVAAHTFVRRDKTCASVDDGKVRLPSPALSLEGPVSGGGGQPRLTTKIVSRHETPRALAYERRARRVSEKASSNGWHGRMDGRMDGKTKR